MVHIHPRFQWSHVLTQSTLFLGTFMIEDESVCDDLITTFEMDKANHRTGVVGRSNGQVVDKNSKDSIEIKFFPDDLCARAARAQMHQCEGLE